MGNFVYRHEQQDDRKNAPMKGIALITLLRSNGDYGEED
jgi:hypothetical protein